MSSLLRAQKSRAVRGFEYGGPSRTRTCDQGIMSPLKTPVFIGKTQQIEVFTNIYSHISRMYSTDLDTFWTRF